jgi:DNA-binding PadR family transcriptional regulator
VPVASEPAVQQLTTTEAAVLALLAIEGERSGYELAKAVENAIGHIWAPARSGLYACLPRLAKSGLAQVRRADKPLYAISAAGRAALEAWFEKVEPGARDTVFLKLFLGGLTTHDVLLRHLAQFQDDVEARLAGYRAIEQTNSNRGHDWYHRHLLTLGIENAERELAWAARVEKALQGSPR